MRRKTYTRICERIKRLERPLVGSRVVRHAPQWILLLISIVAAHVASLLRGGLI
jgi:hypothetical protein